MGCRFGVFEFEWSWVKIQSFLKLRERLPGSNSCKNCLFLIQSIETRMLDNIFKNQLLRSIRRRDIEDFLLFWPWKITSHHIFSSNWVAKIEIWHQLVVKVLNEPFEEVNFSAPFHLVAGLRKCEFWNGFSFFFELHTYLPNRVKCLKFSM